MQKPISYHNFMFPFRFDKIIEPFSDKHEFYQAQPFDSRVAIDNNLKDSLEKDNWSYQKFTIKDHLDYNEIIYFHDFVKDSLFNTNDFKEKATSYYFEKSLQKDATFEIEIKNHKTYKLKLEGVNLRLFDTGVGILSFELENYEYNLLDDILKINDFGRRIYPQFLSEGKSVDSTKDVFLPNHVCVNGIEENFENEYNEIRLAKYITEILGQSFSTDSKAVGSYYIQPIIDDRMFVISWYGNDTFSYKVKESIRESKPYDNWYKYIYLDGGELTVQDEQVKRELIDRATYRRWTEYGTFFGISRYSFVVLTDRSWFPTNILLNHIKTMYFQMVTLLLVQRASILRFSDEITAISDIRNKNIPVAENIANLYKNYLRFVNKLYFKEITPQEQGIELYDKAIDIMNIKRDVEDLRSDISGLNGYAFFEQEREEKAEMNKLT